MPKRKLLPLTLRRAWIQFVVRPKVWQSCATVLVMATFVYLLEGVIYHIVLVKGTCVVWWPINGIMVAALLTARRRHWPWMLAGFSIGLGASEYGDKTLLYLVDPICNSLELLLPAFLLPPFRSLDRWLAQPGVAKRFILIAIVAAPVGPALVAPLYMAPAPGQSYWTVAREYGAADMLGFAMFTPLLLALLSRETWQLFRPAALPKTVGLVGSFVGGSWLIFHQDMFQIAFIVYPLLLALSTELGLSGAILGIDMLAVIATRATIAGVGPFGTLAVNPTVPVMELRVFLVLSVTMALPVAAARVRRLTTETKLKRAWAAMETLATKDGLTGVANRRQFDATLTTEWSRATRQGSHLSLLLIDADHFKAFNDNYGHLAGDACLRALAQAISEIPGRPTDLVARYGGEEFVVLLPGSDAAGALMIAERVRRVTQGLGIPHLYNEEQGRVTVSIGVVSVVPPRSMTAVELVAAADKALYEAKRNGRNRVVVDEPALARPVLA